MRAVRPLAAATVGLSAGCNLPNGQPLNRDSSSLHRFHDGALDRLFSDHADAAQAFGASDAPLSGFSDYSRSASERRLQRVQRLLAELRTFDTMSQTQSQRISSQVLEFFLQYGDARLFPGLRSKPLVDLSFPYLQNLPRTMLIALHPFRHEDDIAAYVSRLRAVPQVVAQARQRLIDQCQANVIPPDFSIDLIATDIGRFVAPAPADNILAVSAAEKMAAIDFDSSAAADYNQQIAQAIDQFVYPAYRSFIKLLARLRKEAGPEPGLCRFSGGIEYYRYLLAANTTLSMEPAEIHELGQSGICEIHAEMRRIFSELGLDYPTLSEGFDAIYADPSFRYDDSAAGRANILGDLARYNDEIRARAGEVFAWLPGEIVVRPVPAELESTSSTSFAPGPIDGSAPGIFFAHMTDLLDVPNFELPVITYHEAIPGHGLQVSRARALENMPSFRRAFGFDAYVEGWAKYAEQLPFDRGYNTDLFASLGRWRLILYSTVNLALDTGVHAFGWNRDKGVEFFRKNAFVSRSFAERIFDQRIVALPAQTCSYKIGYLKFTDLRNRMQAALRDAFSYRHFHSTVLDQGSMPLQVMEDLVGRTITDAKRSPAGS